MTQIFLGEPPANIKQWIIDHATPPGPVGHPETRFTLEDGTVETYDITGTLDTQWMIANGYYDDEGTWLKTITQADIGNTVTIIGDYAFSYCSGLTSVTIPNSVTSIGDSAFHGCSGLTSVTIGNGVTSIGSYAFCNCTSLTSVTIPDNVTSIGSWAFSGCSGLMSISVGSGNANYKSVNGLLLSKDGTTLIQGINGDVVIPDNVTSVGEQAFKGCSGLTSVTIPDSVTSIGRDAFSGCSDLTSVTIIANGGDANSVKTKLIAAGVPESVTWNMPEGVGAY